MSTSVVVQLHEGYAPIVEAAVVWAGLVVLLLTAILVCLAVKR